MPETTRTTNRLLNALPENIFQKLLPKLERIALTFGTNIYQKGDVISHIYFPEAGIISLLSAVADDSTLEVGIVGSEGVVGLPVFLGVEKSDSRAVVQGAGAAFRMTAADLLEECRRADDLPRLLRLFTHSLLTQISQSAVCNRYHPIESRLARWLLMTSDRMRQDEFRITQEFLSNMLGVRREAVNKSATHFQQQQIISYTRGNLAILDRPRLESVACACYQIIKIDFENFLN